MGGGNLCAWLDQQQQPTAATLRIPRLATHAHRHAQMLESLDIQPGDRWVLPLLLLLLLLLCTRLG
jgi:hypothetical protein